MKKIFILLVIIAVSENINAQSLIGGNHILKTNLSADALQNYNITFEKSLNHFMSISASYSTMPSRTLPLQSLAKNFIDNPNINFDNFKISNSAFTLESRFYLGLQKMSGIYIAPYARFGNLEVNVPVNYQYTYTPTAPNGTPLSPLSVATTANLKGPIRSQSVGAYFGMQFQLLTKLVLDFWVIGGHYGSSNGKLQFDAPAGTPAVALDELKKVVDQTKAHPFNLSSSIVNNSDGTKSLVTNTDGPWLGIRGAGLTLGLRF